ncbi:cysteine hydrolase family protein [Nocardiopsis coralliicola]
MATALIFVDVQQNQLAGEWAVAGAPDVGACLAELLERARAAGAAVVHVRNDGTGSDPDCPHTPGWQLVHSPAEGEPVVPKDQPDAFAGTGLEKLLAEAGADTLVIAGMASDLCITATARAALRTGRSVTLAAGAHAGLSAGAAPEAERVLSAEGVRVVPAAEVRFA